MNAFPKQEIREERRVGVEREGEEKGNRRREREEGREN